MSACYGPPRKLGNAEIALAMELKVEGCSNKIIALGLGVVTHTLDQALVRARRFGMIKNKEIR